mmetsp:Transcript_17054/g.47293  ORF Transcript_17054/g.47293 Transcript_17054/m.47293 type:complete len:227 (-) Transcript_17054:187-867(-)
MPSARRCASPWCGTRRRPWFSARLRWSFGSSSTILTASRSWPRWSGPKSCWPSCAMSLSRRWLPRPRPWPRPPAPSAGKSPPGCWRGRRRDPVQAATSDTAAQNHPSASRRLRWPCTSEPRSARMCACMTAGRPTQRRLLPPFPVRRPRMPPVRRRAAAAPTRRGRPASRPAARAGAPPRRGASAAAAGASPASGHPSSRSAVRSRARSSPISEPRAAACGIAGTL